LPTPEKDWTALAVGEHFGARTDIVNMTGISVGLIPWIMSAGTLVLHHPFNPLIFVRQLVEEKVNFTLAVPTVVVDILKHPVLEKLDLSHLRYFAQGGAAPPPWTFVELKRRVLSR
jgi:acyl-CoA synthetase (AMP-forming)/AMP-acid ligase II